MTPFLACCSLGMKKPQGSGSNHGIKFHRKLIPSSDGSVPSLGTRLSINFELQFQEIPKQITKSDGKGNHSYFQSLVLVPCILPGMESFVVVN